MLWMKYRLILRENDEDGRALFGRGDSCDGPWRLALEGLQEGRMRMGKQEFWREGLDIRLAPGFPKARAKDVSCCSLQKPSCQLAFYLGQLFSERVGSIGKPVAILGCGCGLV